MSSYKIIEGIYLIHCGITNKSYIGSSKSIVKRWDNHKYLLRKGIHHNSYLQSAWNKYGGETFSFSILEKTNSLTKSELERVETKWILFYKSHLKKFGYNLTMPGAIPLKQEGENKTKTRKRGFSIIGINSDNEVTVFASISEASILLNFLDKKIREVCYYWEQNYILGKRSYKGWIFMKEEFYDSSIDYHSQYKTRVTKPRVKKKYNYNAKKKPEDIIPYTLRNLKRQPIIAQDAISGEIIRFSSIREAKLLGYSTSKIYKCINNEFMKYKHKGFWWKKDVIQGSISNEVV